MKVLAIIVIISAIATLGCGLTLHFGGEAFRNAVKGHMLLGVFATVSALALGVMVLVGRR